MILPVQESRINSSFGRSVKKEAPEHDMLLENNFSNRAMISLDKFTKAFTIYPARGLKGSINSDFYEFLTMGTVPYVIGSLTLMSVFNSANKFFNVAESSKASKIGKKMALGVLFYGIMKELSKKLINTPTKWITGVDTQIPYIKVNHQLPENAEDTDLTSFEYHKVGESVEFTRWDLLYGNPKDKKALNKKFDRIAKKNGLGENLNDSDQEVKPLYKEILVKSTLARSFSSYLWAATGVALAFQKPWEEFFNAATLKFWKTDEFKHTIELLGKSLKNSLKELYNGPHNAKTVFNKHSGKALIYTAAAVTLLGLLNIANVSKKPAKVQEKDVMDKNKESVVG